MSTKPRYTIEYHITSTDEDDHEATFKVRRNGKVFCIEISPVRFVNSPIMTEKYQTYLQVLRSGEQVIDDVYETDVYDWVMTPFEPLLIELAPPPSGDTLQINVSLQEYIFPKYLVFHLDIIDEKLTPRRIFPNGDPLYPSCVRFDDAFLNDLQTWTTLWDPRAIQLSFPNPEDALFKQPKKVLLPSQQLECFFKPCHFAVEAMRELKAYKAIAAAGLHEEGLKLCRMHGVVLDDREFVLGILLSHVNSCLPLSMLVCPDDPDDPPQTLRQAWMQQIDTTVSKFHKAGIVWGDVKAANVLIDPDSNAWVVDFGGGYTRGWVDEAVAGTVKGDEMGMANMRTFLFSSNHDLR